MKFKLCKEGSVKTRLGVIVFLKSGVNELYLLVELNWEASVLDAFLPLYWNHHINTGRVVVEKESIKSSGDYTRNSGRGCGQLACVSEELWVWGRQMEGGIEGGKN